ncbi:hypothetical protein J2X55_003472 [Microbacterium sp. 1154]|uniref:hypothetical protein n=1 Tax=Microbacterium sp. 1154 TaxID=2817733 RepID=UPI002858EECB|nr:hypothetical protein [Microbacterium sp. 1154]MDR6692527.1 hypothetical protein [Microbacterium sp. 1154]
MTEITEVRRSRDWRTLAAVCWRWIFDEKILGKGDLVQLGNTVYEVTFWGLSHTVILKDPKTGVKVHTSHSQLGNVRLIKRAPRRPRAKRAAT